MSTEPNPPAEPVEKPPPQTTWQPSSRPPLPTSIWLYVFVILLTYFAGALAPGEPPLAFDQRLAVMTFFRLLFIFLVVKRSTIGWIVAAAFEGLQIILWVLLPEADMIKRGIMLFLHSAALALLLTRATRVFVRSDYSVATAPGAAVRDRVASDDPSSQTRA